MEKENTSPSFFDLFRFKEDGQMVDPHEIPEFERKFLFPLSILGAGFSLLFTIIDFFWSLNEGLKILAWAAFVFYFITFLYFLTKKVKYFTFIKWLFIVTTLVFIDWSWYFHYRANGPTLYVLFLLYGYFVFMLRKKQRLVSSLLLLTNLLVIAILDYSGYLPPSHYPNEFMLEVDLYAAVTIYTIVAFVLMSNVKRIYLQEYNKARESDKLKTSFLANISHEIRTPLNAIVGFSNLMLTEDVSLDEKKQYGTIINQNNKFLLELVNDILDISMIESNNIQLEEQQNDLKLIMTELEKVYSIILKKLGKERIELIKSVPEDYVSIVIDGSYLDRALRHLLDNAVKFTEEGRIIFGFSVNGKSIRFFVKDTGIGIKELDKDSLFERFNKLEYNRKKMHAGTGIGLYLVKLIAERFGGQVFVESTFEEGSTFGFTVPAKEMKIENELKE